MEAVLRLTNSLKELAKVREWLDAQMAALPFGEELRSDIQLISEEVLANIIAYGFASKGPTAEIALAFVWDGRSLTLDFEDNGVPFDPLAQPDPSLDDEEDRDVGGLGIYLIKQLSHQQEYVRENDRNRLRVTRIVELEGAK